MKELVVISGKGGAGKTSLVASLAALARPLVLVDCDVDAADLHLVLEPTVLSREEFRGGSKATIRAERCTACGKCEALCRFDAIGRHAAEGGLAALQVDRLACEGCGVCADACPEQAIEFAPVVAGEWFVSETRCGPMIHARLGVAAENSGKLVTHIRRAAQQVAVQRGRELILCDGSPGIGCPVIASLTGASLAVFVVEPTVSGLHDFQRVAELALRLAVPGVVVVNKADLNPEMAEQASRTAFVFGMETIGSVPYDTEVTRALLAGRSVVEFSLGPAAHAVQTIWREIEKRLAACRPASTDGLIQLSTQSTTVNTISDVSSPRSRR